MWIHSYISLMCYYHWTLKIILPAHLLWTHYIYPKQAPLFCSYSGLKWHHHLPSPPAWKLELMLNSLLLQLRHSFGHSILSPLPDYLCNWSCCQYSCPPFLCLSIVTRVVFLKLRSDSDAISWKIFPRLLVFPKITPKY